MDKGTKHERVKLIVGLIGQERLFEKVKALLAAKFGKLDFQSKVIEFNFTDYYAAEMGTDLKRQFLSFKNLIPPTIIPTIKRYTNNLEQRYFSSGGKRLVNIDPGYLTLSKLVLATTKDHQHRLYLDKGIFAEVTLRYRNKTFCAWDWTYPDYRSKEYIAIFNHIRNGLYQIRKNKHAK